MKLVVQNIIGEEPTDGAGAEFEGPDILADASNIIDNEDVPANGEWDFDLKEVWSVDGISTYSLAMPGNIHVGGDGKISLLDRGSAEICVLDQNGKLLFSFGGYRDGAGSDLCIPTRVNQYGKAGDRYFLSARQVSLSCGYRTS